MKRRPRLRRILKWAGTAVCLLLIGLFALSMRYQVDWKNPDASVHLAFWAGHVILDSSATARPLMSRPGWHFGRISGPLRDLAAVPFRPPSVYWSAGRIRLECPLWIPLVLAAAPTVILWRRDRHRPPPGHCQKCGYNLTGNVSGRCPECGMKTEARTSAQR
jgi:hypothetical protein